jgi:YD repeat-containing protein
MEKSHFSSNPLVYSLACWEISVLRKILLITSAYFLSQFCASAPASAQMPSGCLTDIIWYFPDPIPFGFTVMGPAQGPFSFIISAMSYQCVPPQSEPCPQCLLAGAPISLSSGNTFITQADIKIPGLGSGLSLTRTWNSTWPSTQSAYQVGIFGSHWRSTYEEFIFTGTDGYLKYSRADGGFWSFGIDTGFTFRVASPANISASLVQGTSYTTITFQNGEQRRFDNSTGKLIAILDRNGNMASLTYDGSGRLVTVTDPASRHLTFTYASPSSYIVTSVSSDVGISVSYAYDTQGRLSTVTEQDLSTLNFTYNTQSLITQVTDTAGKILESHTYDSSARGLTSSKASGVESLTITYP